MRPVRAGSSSGRSSSPVGSATSTCTLAAKPVGVQHALTAGRHTADRHHVRDAGPQPQPVVCSQSAHQRPEQSRVVRQLGGDDHGSADAEIAVDRADSPVRTT
jgi:hypothetical protein